MKHTTYTCDRCHAEFTCDDQPARVGFDRDIARKVAPQSNGFALTWDLCDKCIAALVGFLRRRDPEASS